MTKPPLPARGPRFAEHVVLGHKFRTALWQSEEGTSARPLLFFSGIGANIELLSPLLGRLRGREVVTLDMPGLGGSPEYRRPYRLAAMADAANEILAQMGYAEVDVMGVSWGGMLAQEFAYRHRRKVGRLVLAATSPGIPMIPGNMSTLIKMVSSHRYSSAESIQTYLKTLYGGSSNDLDSYASRIQAPSLTGYLHQVLAIMGWTSVRKLTLIPNKTLIVMGQDDRLVPSASGHILKFLLRNAELKIVEDGGHLFVLTHADRVARMIEDFLDEWLPTGEALPPGTRAALSRLATAQQSGGCISMEPS